MEWIRPTTETSEVGPFRCTVWRDGHSIWRWKVETGSSISAWLITPKGMPTEAEAKEDLCRELSRRLREMLDDLSPHIPGPETP